MKDRIKTVTLGSMAASILLALPAIAGNDNNSANITTNINNVQHVLLISVDGMHQSDLAWYVQTHPKSTLAS
ncbi:MAG: hypothetical protein JOZ31_23770, partial [Verrucomicrobia bacterium]|nr:hypothetical protein [Verrucomicrobiota bacterium]